MTTVSSAAEVDQLKRALVAMRTMRERLDRLERAQTEPIAIIGMGLRLPGGSHDARSFWRLLRDGVDAIQEVPADRWDVDGYYSSDPTVPGRMPSRFGGFIDDVDLFDAAFFGISPREAATMDPQQRLMLQVAWEALEDAGHAPSRLRGSRTGVFVGMGLNDYGRLQIPGQAVDPTVIEHYFASGNALCITANRISFALDLHGPSLVVDTACSSSLVAVHLACQSLRSGESSLALVGGVNLMLAPASSISLARMLAPDGRCKTFDALADGYVRAEGAAIVVLKPLRTALADGDPIYAVVRGSAVNQDGHSSGLTVPNGVAQQALLREALDNARTLPAQIDYVEAHGTGTSLGDPIEANALGAVFGPQRAPDRPLWLGSVKTNIGHLEAAAGIGGLIKVALALEHRQIPASLHFDKPNPLIPFESLALRVQHTLTDWPAGTGLPVAGVSSFGFGGVNAHVILEAAPAPELVSRTVAERPRHLLALSATNPDALRRVADRFANLLTPESSLSLGAVCHSANTGRSHFTHRLAIVAATADEARDRLRSVAQGQSSRGAWLAEVDGGAQSSGVVFLFTGQGAQSVGMGRGLYETQPVFRATLDRCAALLSAHLEPSLLDVLYPAPGREADAKLLLDQTAVTQPALFAVEVALAALWKSWGIEPSVVLGHSVGELVAACVAGVYSLEDGLALVAARGRLMQELPAAGAMAAIFADPAAVRAALVPYASTVAVASINGPRHTVISGPAATLDVIAQAFRDQGVRVQPLAVSHAFHSPLLDPMLDAFERSAAAVPHALPRLPLISTLNGARWPDGAGPDAAYWRRHARDTVRFADAVKTADELATHVFIEIGPHPTLLGMARETVAAETANRRLWLPSLRRGRDDTQQMLESLAQLYTRGATVDWSAFDDPFHYARVRLPTYPFERERHWFKQTAQALALLPSAPVRTPEVSHSFLGPRLHSPALSGYVFESAVDRDSPSFLVDHRLRDDPVFPAAAYVEVLLEAGVEVFGGAACVVDELVIQEPMVLPPTGNRLMQVVVTPGDQQVAGVQVFSRTGPEKVDGTAAPEWHLHATGTLRCADAGEPRDVVAVPGEVGPHAFMTHPDAAAEMSVADFYAWGDEVGLGYGPSFRGIEQLWRGDGEALGRVRLPDSAGPAFSYAAHPALLDACLQVSGALLQRNQGDDPDPRPYVPVALEGVRLHHRLAGTVWSHVSLLTPAAPGAEAFSVGLRLFDEAGRTVMDIARLHLRRAAPPVAASKTADNWLYQVRWTPSPPVAANALPPESGGPWLIFADPGGTGAALAQHLSSTNAECTLVRPGTALKQLADGSWELRPDRPEDIRLLVQRVTDAGRPFQGIVHLWSLASADDVEPTPAALHAAQVLGCASVLHLIQALAEAAHTPRLWLVTRGAQALTNTEQPAVIQTPLLGLARTIRLEFPSLGCALVDVDPADHIGAAASLIETIHAPAGEDEIAYRAGIRHVARLVPLEAEASQRSSPAVTNPRVRALRVSDNGVLGEIQLVAARRVPPGPGEVEIRVRAAGLNFRDVLKALGLYLGDPGPLGDECAGTISAVGAGVAERYLGEEVLAMASGSMSTYVTTPADLVVRRPSGLDNLQAASLPIAYGTARYALEHLAKVQPGERVLIHAAAGGVGLAAVHLAQRAGAEVFATAGSPIKRDYLRSLGVKHTFDSRSTAFADQILAETGGEGVHVVLNSLTGDSIPASMAALKNGGRFVEIGKRGIWDHAQVADLGRGIEYFVLYLGAICLEQPAAAQALLRSIVADVEAGLVPPLPVRAFPIGESASAFRFMAQARHIGKVALVLESDRQGHAVAIRHDATYLVTGGLSGLGLQVAQDLVSRGARHLVLVGRGEPGVASRAIVREMESTGAHVAVMQADVAQYEDVSRIIAAIHAGMPPLRGVVHAAGVIEDGILQNQNWAGFERVLAPKLQGTWHLHTLTTECPLDFFVLFSAGAALLGSAGQANYTAANAFLDGIAHLRRARGVPALSVNWGPWDTVGMAARLGDTAMRRLAGRGFGSIAPQRGLDILHDLLDADATQVAVMPMDWGAYARSFLGAQPGSLVADCVKPAQVPNWARLRAQPVSSLPHVLEQIAEAPRGARRGLVQRFVRTQAGTVLDLDPSRIDPRRALNELGLDSLMAVELRNALATSFKLELSVTLLFDYPTVDELTAHLLRTLESDTPVPTGGAIHSASIDELARLSEDEAEQLLLAELAQ